MILRIENAGSPAAQRLIAALDEDIVSRYPGESTNGIDVAGFEAAGGVFVVCYVDDMPVACGAFRPFEGSAEIKRMYVVPALRGRGLARAMLDFLEAEAARRGFSRAILETGRKMTEALGLYRSRGWREIPVFGPYVGDPKSICFEKRLAKLLQG
ncbi:MAG: GNAT family N-acetyltransferase [Rhizomicrobium sp.]|jgi:GNAT superfamily N-acetyltransferase